MLRMVGVKMTVIKIMPVVVDMGKSAVFSGSAIMAVNMRIILMFFVGSIVMLVLMPMRGFKVMMMVGSMLFMVSIMLVFMMLMVLRGTRIMGAVPVMLMGVFIS
jgi:hypothetical protein